MQLTMQSVEKLQNFLPLVSFTQWMNEVEYARKIEWDKKKKNHFIFRPVYESVFMFRFKTKLQLYYQRHLCKVVRPTSHVMY